VTERERERERERGGKTDNRCKCVLVGEVLNVLLSLVTWPPRTDDLTDDVTAAAEDDGTDVGSGSQLSVPSNSMASAAEPRLSTSSWTPYSTTQRVIMSNDKRYLRAPIRS